MNPSPVSAMLGFIAVLLSALMTGCSAEREIKGQMFVVMESGANVKMGLVGIQHLPRKQVQPTAVRLLGEYRAAEQRMAVQHAQHEADEATLGQFAKDVQALNPFKLSVPEIDALTRECDERREKLKSGRQTAYMAFAEAKSDIQEVLLDGWPKPKTKTDADGHFSLKAQPGDWLVARSSRKILNKEEKYLWAISVTDTKEKMLMANDGLIEGPSGLIKLLGAMSGDSRASAPIPPPAPSAEVTAWVVNSTRLAKLAVIEAEAARERALVVAIEMADRLIAEAKVADERAAAEAKAAAERAASKAKVAAERAAAEAKAAAERAASEAKVAAERAAAEAKAAAEKRIAWTGSDMRRAGFSDADIISTLVEGGTVSAWGRNNRGQCKVPVDLRGVVAISAGDGYVLAVKSDGTVVAWGLNNSGQCNVPSGLTGVVAVAAASGGGMALKSDGTVVAWGYGRIPDVPAGLTDVIAIVAGLEISAALKSDGTIITWPKNFSYTYDMPKVFSGVAEIALGYHNTFTLMKNGEVLDWGMRAKGHRPQGIRAISAKSFSFIALKNDGTAMTSDILNPNPGAKPVANVTDLVAVAAGTDHFAAVSRQGKVFVWGDKADGDDEHGVRKIPADLGHVTAISAGNGFMVALSIPKSAAKPAANSTTTMTPGGSPRLASLLANDQKMISRPGANEQPIADTLGREKNAAQVGLAEKPILEKPLSAMVEKQVPQHGKNWTIPKLNLEMIPVAAGIFQMGSSHSSLGKDEHPVTSVTLTMPFWLGRTSVTQTQYEILMGSNPSNFKGSNRPVEKVSWNDAVEFCRKLTKQERAAGRLPEDCRYTLPTEAQREYACRAGAAVENPVNMEAISWHGSLFGGTHPVGEKQANAWGFFDMQGNVYEWCGDWVGKYPGGSAVDPTGPVSGHYRIIRGGSFNSPASFCRSTFRWEGEPDTRKLNIGFRVALVSSR